jgi:UDP-glucose:(heptosyl)LPS alpha-1,3-glucosyltransferase
LGADLVVAMADGVMPAADNTEVMKIALVNKVFSRSHGGLERFSVNLAGALLRAGHEVHVFGQRFADLPEGVTVHSLPISRKPSWWRVLDFHDRAARALAVGRYDITMGLTRFFPMDVYRMGDGVQRHWMCIRYPFPLWRWLNYLVNPAHMANIYMERRILKRGGARRIITNSHLCKEQACHYYGIPEEKIEVVYNGVDHTLFNPEAGAALRSVVRSELGLANDDIALLHVSNNWGRKGVDVTLRAIAALGQSGQKMHLLVVGRGKAEPFRRLALGLGLEGRVHFVGSSPQVERYYAAGDLLVLPTLYDPFSNVCLEAMACGLPVVTTAGNGASEIIEEGKNGFVQMDAKSIPELAEILENCLDPDALRKMGDEACRVSQEFTPERNMWETLAVFKKTTPIEVAK